jgi:hypothetical protein
MNKPLIKIFGSNEPYVSPGELAALLNIRSEPVSDWLTRYSDFPAVRLPGVIRIKTVTTPKPSRETPMLTKEAQITTMLRKELNALKAAGTLTQDSQTKRDNLVNQIRTIEHEGFEFWEENTVLVHLW